MSAADLHQMDVAALSVALAERKTSAVEAATQLLTRAKLHAGLGAFLAMNEDATLAQARAADARLAAGERTPLLGVPLAHKDIFVTRDFPTTAGSKMLAGYQSPFDATVVQRLSAAGAVTLGKLNCDEFAMGSGNDNSAFGPAHNPWDVSRVPGGSSGGSAAAVAARLVPAASGTDTGGSIRQPAAFCGITGIKPTYGRCSRYGMVAFASSLDQAGPMARSAADCAVLLSAMAGPDIDRDSTSLDRPAEDYSAALQQVRAGATAAQPLKGLRIGLPVEFFGAGCAPDVLAAVGRAPGAARHFPEDEKTTPGIVKPGAKMSRPSRAVRGAQRRGR
jgi:aspartyl-tRNA(Asn)/glutamyl-tRNA(Gln) amidotransferase subunit A